MKKTILGLGLVAILAGVGLAQVDSKTSSTASVSKNGGSIDLQSGTQIAAQLQNSIDVQKARVGDEVVLKTTTAIKQNGKTVIDKGATLYGRVTEVQQKTKNNGESKVGILFDKLQQGSNQLPINAVITSITKVQAQTSIDDSMDSDISGGASTQTSTNSSSKNDSGLIGGVKNTVGSVVNTTTKTAGKVANKVGKTVTGTTETALNNIQISQSADASVNGGATLSLPNKNLRLDKGVIFNLNVSESTTVRTN
jgi:hypothetical protein